MAFSRPRPSVASRASRLPRSLAVPYSNTERFGFVIVIVLIVTGTLGFVLGPLYRLALGAVSALTGVRLPF